MPEWIRVAIELISLGLIVLELIILLTILTKVERIQTGDFKLRGLTITQTKGGDAKDSPRNK